MTFTSYSKENLIDLRENYQKVTKLIKEDSKNDPPNEPFLSKYAAKKILNQMKESIENVLKNNELTDVERRKILGRYIQESQLVLSINKYFYSYAWYSTCFPCYHIY